MKHSPWLKQLEREKLTMGQFFGRNYLNVFGEFMNDCHAKGDSIGAS